LEHRKIEGKSRMEDRRKKVVYIVSTGSATAADKPKILED
jgi:hypothetical protein